MKKHHIAYFLIFFLFYVLWLFKGDEWMGADKEPVVQTDNSEVSDGRNEFEAGIQFAWLLGY